MTTTNIKNQTKAALVPKLRFPEFRGAEGWTPERLGSVGQLTRGLTYSAEDVAPAGLLVLRSTNIQAGSLVLDQDLVFVGKPCPEALRLQTGDIVICMSNGSKALVGKSGEYSGEYEGNITVGAFCSFFRPAFPFAKIAFHLNSYQRYIADLIAGGNINNLTNSVLEEFSFPVPPLLAEQQKIAECLSSLDELIAAQARKVDALKTHKKGLMQQLFPREGETQPRLRFPEFRGAGEWEVGPLNQFAQINPRREIRADDVEVSFIPMNAVSENGHLASPQTRNYGLVKKGFTAFKDNDVIVAKITPCFENGKAALVTELINGIGFGSTEFHVVRANSSCLPEFMFAQIYSDQFRYLGKASMTGSGGQQRVPTAFIENYLLSVPSLPEQQRIAMCLSSLDTLITAATQELETLKTHKKGLMQQLFPSVEVVEA